MILDNNITLIGMPASGKSTLGRLLSNKLGYSFKDCDEIIEQAGRRLQEIIDIDGENAFLLMEERAILGLSGKKNVFSPGGSCVLLPHAMAHLRAISLVMFIDVPLPVLKARLLGSKASSRGIIGQRNMDLAMIYLLRTPLYKEYANLVVHLGDNSLRLNLETLTRALRQLPKYFGSDIVL